MSEKAPLYGDTPASAICGCPLCVAARVQGLPDGERLGQPAVPSTRVSEAELQEIIDTFAGYPDMEPLHRPDAESVVALGSEVRRYRALLIGLGDDLLGSDAWCSWCQRSFVGEAVQHDEGCPVGAVEAEVQAIRAERQET